MHLGANLELTHTQIYIYTFVRDLRATYPNKHHNYLRHKQH